MTSVSSSSVAPLSFAYCRWKVSCSALPPVSSAATVTRLRSRGDSCGRFHTSPNSTSSVKCTSPGAKSPNIVWAPEGSFWSAMSEFLSIYGRSVTAFAVQRTPVHGDLGEPVQRGYWQGPPEPRRRPSATCGRASRRCRLGSDGDGHRDVAGGGGEMVGPGLQPAEDDEPLCVARRAVEDRQVAPGGVEGDVADVRGGSRRGLRRRQPRGQVADLLRACEVLERQVQRQERGEVPAGGRVAQGGTVHGASDRQEDVQTPGLGAIELTVRCRPRVDGHRGTTRTVAARAPEATIGGRDGLPAVFAGEAAAVAARTSAAARRGA